MIVRILLRWVKIPLLAPGASVIFDGRLGRWVYGEPYLVREPNQQRNAARLEYDQDSNADEDERCDSMAIAPDRRAQCGVAHKPMREEAPRRRHDGKHHRDHADLIAGMNRKSWDIDANVIGAIRDSDQRNCRGSRIAP